MPRLPARTGADVHLADAFAEPGCPLCREADRSERAYLESVLAESVNDVPFRRALDAARGFCGLHARAILDADRRRAGSLGAAILLRATLAPRLRELEAASAARGRGRSRRVEDAARPPDCPACRRARTSDAGRVEGLVRLTAEPAWAAALAQAPVCLDHLVTLMAVRSAPPAWSGVEAAQLARLTGLRDRLDGFSHTSSHDRRHRQTDAERVSPDQAAELLAGGVPDAAPATPPAAAGPSKARDAAARDGTTRDGTTRDGPTRDARAVLLTGVYGAGKTTTAIELVDRLDELRVPVAAIDLDWLGWYGAPVAWDEHEDPRLTLENLASLRAAYLRVGVRRFVLAGTIRGEGPMDRLRAVMAMPLTVVRLDAPIDVIASRLAGDPNASRADDLRVAAEDLDADAAALPRPEWVVPADRAVAAIVDDLLERLGWREG